MLKCWCVFFFKQKTAYEMRISDWSSDVCSSDLTIAEIERLVERFADAAQRCQRAGFDGVQIHAANGYLMSQFLTAYTNRRTDAYGGSLEQRTRLLREVIGAIRSRVGRDFPLIVKMNGSDYRSDEHPSALQSLMRNSYAVFCSRKK